MLPRSSLSQCPDATTIQTPDGADEWTDAKHPAPKWFSFVFHSWKGVKKNQMKKLNETVQVVQMVSDMIYECAY